MAALSPHDLMNIQTCCLDRQGAEILRARSVNYPKRMQAKYLMAISGLDFHTHQVSAFASLCFQFIRINEHLQSYGLQAVRTGGTPDDHYRLIPA